MLTVTEHELNMKDSGITFFKLFSSVAVASVLS